MSRAVLWVGPHANDVREIFDKGGHRVEFADSAPEARRILLRREPQSVIFGSAAPATLTLIRAWRAEGRDVTVLVAARPDTDEPRKALAAGATDYLLAPIGARAALTRLETHLNRRPPPTQLELSDRRVDLAGRRVQGPNGDVELTAIEARLLAFLGTEPGQPVRTETILRQVWGYGHALKTRAVANAVMRLRRKIEIDAARPRHLLTVRSVGYRLVARAASDQRMAPPAGPLIGREMLLETATAALAQGPLLLHGPPGVGKSRLAHALAEAWHGQVARVELEEVAHAAELLQVLALRLSMPLPAGSTLASIGRLLAARGPLLLWFDGADRVADALAKAVRAWPSGHPRVLVTSQLEVHAAGLTSLRVGPLAPEDAMTLLRERALDAGAPSGLAYTSAAARALVETLDCLPLTVLLAARRLPFIDFEQLRQRTAAIADREGIGRSLQGAWGQLSEPARRLLWTAARFVGPFGLDALEQVAAFDAQTDPWLPDVLVALIRRSLVEQDVHAPDVARFRMLACVRHWALRHPPAPEPRARIEANVVDFVLRTCESAADGLDGASPERSLTTFERLLPALRSLGQHETPTIRLRARLALGRLLHFRGTLVGHVEGLLDGLSVSDDALADRARLQAARFLRGLGRLDDASAQLDAVTSAALRARVWAERAEIAIENGDFDGVVAATQAGITTTREPLIIGRLLDLEATARHYRGEPVARLQARALAALKRANARWAQAVVRHNLGFEALERGELASALRDFERFEQIARACQRQRFAALVGVNVGRVLIERGDAADAERVLRRSLADLREADFPRGEALALANLALALIDQERPVAARHVLREAIIVAEAHGLGPVGTQAALWLGVLAHLDGDLEGAATAYAQVEAHAPGNRRITTLISEARALLALGRGEAPSSPIPYARDPARHAWVTALLAALRSGDAEERARAEQAAFVARSFEGRILCRLAARIQPRHSERM